MTLMGSNRACPIHVRNSGGQNHDAVLKAIGIARDAVDRNVPRSMSRTRRYVADTRYHDQVHLLSKTHLLAASDNGMVEFSCDPKRFEIRILPFQSTERKPIVSVKERIAPGERGPLLDAREILAVLDRWTWLLQTPEPCSRERWDLVAQWIMAQETMGRIPMGILPEDHLELPSAHADARILRQVRIGHLKHVATQGPAAQLMDRDSELCTTIRSLCPTLQASIKQIDHRASIRLQCDLSARIMLPLPASDAMSSLRSMAEVESILSR